MRLVLVLVLYWCPLRCASVTAATSQILVNVQMYDGSDILAPHPSSDKPSTAGLIAARFCLGLPRLPAAGPLRR